MAIASACNKFQMMTMENDKYQKDQDAFDRLVKSMPSSPPKKKNVLKQTLTGAAIGATGGGAFGLLLGGRPLDPMVPPEHTSVTKLIADAAAPGITKLIDMLTNPRGIPNGIKETKQNAKHLFTGNGFADWQPDVTTASEHMLYIREGKPAVHFGRSNPGPLRETLLSEHRDHLRSSFALTTVAGTAVGAVIGFYKARQHNARIDEKLDAENKWQEKINKEKRQATQEQPPSR